jgi:hypothetical protein
MLVSSSSVVSGIKFWNLICKASKVNVLYLYKVCFKFMHIALVDASTYLLTDLLSCHFLYKLETYGFLVKGTSGYN